LINLHIFSFKIVGRKYRLQQLYHFGESRRFSSIPFPFCFLRSRVEKPLILRRRIPIILVYGCWGFEDGTVEASISGRFFHPFFQWEGAGRVGSDSVKYHNDKCIKNIEFLSTTSVNVDLRFLSQIDSRIHESLFFTRFLREPLICNTAGDRLPCFPLRSEFVMRNTHIR
jgi:hypothetical protein